MLDDATLRPHGVGDNLGLRRWDDLVGGALENEQGRPDAIGQVDRGPLAVAVDRVRPSEPPRECVEDLAAER